MKKFTFALIGLTPFLFSHITAQIPRSYKGDTSKILKAEDERRYDKTLEIILAGYYEEKYIIRALLAAGRIGDERAIPKAAYLLNDPSENVAEMAAFAIGEIESIKASDAILTILKNPKTPDSVRARAVEAGGKIAAANTKDEKSKLLGNAILDTLENEDRRGAKQSRDVVLLGLTAALRAAPKEANHVRPDKTDSVVAKFLTNLDARIRADAANALSRVRAKNANAALRSMLMTDSDGNARANAARALGAAEDKDAFNILLEAATEDEDSRVRVSAIRSLAALKDAKAADKLLDRGEKLLADYKRSKFANPVEKSELLEVATSIGKLLGNTTNARAIRFLCSLREVDKYRSPETEIAYAQVDPKGYVNLPIFEIPVDSGFGYGFFTVVGMTYYAGRDPKALGNFAQGFAAIADNNSADKETVEKAKKYVSMLARGLPVAILFSNPEVYGLMDETGSKGASPPRQEAVKKEIEKFGPLKKELINAFPEVLRADAKLKPEGYERQIAELLLNKEVIVVTATNGKKFAVVYESDDPKTRERDNKEREFYPLHQDPIVRATAAELVGEIKDVNWSTVLAAAFDYSIANDRELNDAQLAVLEAAAKQTPVKKAIFDKALNSPDALVRQKALQLIAQNEGLKKEYQSLDYGLAQVAPNTAGAQTKLGQVLNTDADYLRAVSRKNGTVKAIFTTQKGSFTIDLLPEDAPLTVDNFIKLTRARYFNGVEVHRVVPNFVMQDGDPRGDGNGGPGWSIRCEVNMVSYERGAVGMALSGKDTGGSQWFVTHSPQPHLDGGYTVFGRVNETGMKVVDNIVRGDKIISVKIVESISPQRTQRKSQNRER
jgi:cyclophilin family peptidyl-prolyl cis-trans isomerase/HEAT repeat protein